MIGGALKTGIAVGLGYTLGGSVGTTALRAVSPNASADAVVGAAWAGRVATFIVLSMILARTVPS